MTTKWLAIVPGTLIKHTTNVRDAKKTSLMNKSTSCYDGNRVDKILSAWAIRLRLMHVFVVSDIAKSGIQLYITSILQENNSCDYIRI